jgi:hypothetical protein
MGMGEELENGKTMRRSLDDPEGQRKETQQKDCPLVKFQGIIIEESGRVSL